MRIPYFMWKGKDSREMGVVVNAYPPLAMAKERVETVTVPGRPGTLTVRQGVDVYDPCVRPCDCTLLETADTATVFAWLTGDSPLIFGNESKYVYTARIDGQVDFIKFIRGSQRRTFTIPFVCQPYKMLAVPASDIIITKSGTQVMNIGTLHAKPLIKVEGSGDGAIAMGGYHMELRGMSGGLVLDCDAQDAFDLSMSSLQNDKVQGAFPLLRPGANYVTYTGGVTKVTITPRWRYL